MRESSTAQDRRFRERMALRAIETRAPLLAASLHAYAEAEGMDWPALAASLGCSPDDLNRIALCRPPRPERFAEDARAIAEGCADADRLARLLRRLQALESLRDAAASGNAAAGEEQMLLAARDYADAETDEPHRSQGRQSAGSAQEAAGEETPAPPEAQQEARQDRQEPDHA